MMALSAVVSLVNEAEAANGRRLFGQLGLWTQFERRGWASGYYSGDLIRNFQQTDPVLGHTYADEAGLQLDALKALGITHITFELRTADAATATNNCATTGIFPSCQVCAALGLDWPQPVASDLANLKAFFALLAGKHVTADLVLNTTHMNEPRANSAIWIGSILKAVKNSPALGMVVFGGDAHTIDTNGDGTPDACGTQAEAPLWLGATSYAGKYLKWAMAYAISRGIPARKVSAEAIVGDYFLDSQPPAGPSATGRHLWKPIGVLKGIFDTLKIPNGSRRYAASFYEHTKCSTAHNLTCKPDLDPHAWAEDRLRDALAVIGSANAKNLVMVEAGTLAPQTWPAERAYESLGFLAGKYGIAGINFWRWTAFANSEEGDPSIAQAVKMRGAAFTYFPPKNEIVDLGGYHLNAVPNGSFEQGKKTPALWVISGNGTASRHFLAKEAGQPQVPSRGSFDLRLLTGSDANATVQASSGLIAVDPDTTYTTTANLRFHWSGDPGGPPASRPQVFVSLRFFKANRQASALNRSVTFSYYQENGAADFQTFPMQYATPSDAAFVKIVVGAARNGLAAPITLDADNLR